MSLCLAKNCLALYHDELSFSHAEILSSQSFGNQSLGHFLVTLFYFFKRKYPQHCFLGDPSTLHYIVLTLLLHALWECQQGSWMCSDIYKFLPREGVEGILHWFLPVETVLFLHDQLRTSAPRPGLQLVVRSSDWLARPSRCA